MCTQVLPAVDIDTESELSESIEEEPMPVLQQRSPERKKRVQIMSPRSPKSPAKAHYEVTFHQVIYGVITLIFFYILNWHMST